MRLVKVTVFILLDQELVYLVERIEPFQVQTFGSHCSVEPFNDSILGWFSGLYKFDYHFIFRRPERIPKYFTSIPSP